MIRKTLQNIFKTGTTLAGISGVYAALVEPEWYETRFCTLHLPRLEREFHGYRIVQISDFHVDEWLGLERLHDVIQRVNRLDADLIAITGDFASYDLPPYRDQMIHSLRQLSAPDGVVAILGNHDYLAGVEGIRNIIYESGLTELINCVYTVHAGRAMLHIAGIDDAIEGEPDLDAILEQIPEEGAAILLAHEPDFAVHSAKTGRFDLQLSGHSHGGQIHLPLIWRGVLPDMGERYPMGLYRVGEMWQYTNRGIGMVKLKMRFNCRPEITVFTLMSER